jgi:hypothetical protein
VEAGQPASGLTEITMRWALRTTSRDRAFVARLEHARAPFWVAVHDALVAIDAEMHATV